MSKRFTYGETIDYNFFDVFEEKKYLGMVQRDSTKIVDRLNELAEENEQLKSERRNYTKEFSALFKQNLGLKRENDKLKKEVKND